mgnify:CR=1 FL=1
MLPALRQDLEIIEGAPDKTGAPNWLLHDALAHKFHGLSARAFTLISQWTAMQADAFLARINTAQEPPYSEDDIEDMAAFLYAQKLTALPPNADSASLSDQESAAKRPLGQLIFHSYLFFRIPLFAPQRFLQNTYPAVRPLLSKPFAVFTLICGLFGLFMAAQQWDTFKATFLHFLSFEGLIFYGLTLCILKILHELGHAYMAVRYGAKVPVIGLAFLVLFPILYTDTTDAWRVKSRRARLLIGGAGMMAELSIACFALLLWSFLPDGTLRSAAFFAATASWTLSLLVNLNPLMRFDGYYLLGDWTGIRNLQERGFALGKWAMRETVFGLGHDAPEALPRRAAIWMLIYAYATWVYRFFLFIGIALLVHALFPRAIGIVLFVAEIGFFIARPIWAELTIWWRLKMEILKTRKSRLSGAVFAVALAAFFVPWQSKINAPAIMQPAVQSELFSMSSGSVERIYVRAGERVKKGQILIRLSSPDLIHHSQQSELRLAMIQAQIARRAASDVDRSGSTVLMQALRKERAHKAGLDALSSRLILRAPVDGIVTALSPDLHMGRTLPKGYPLGRIVQPGQVRLTGFAPEIGIARIAPGAHAVFIADDIRMPKFTAQITAIAPTAEAVLAEPVLASSYAGKIAVRPAQGNSKSLIPASAIARLDAKLTRPLDAPEIPPRAIRGALRIKAKPQSPASAIWRRVSAVLLREADF